MKNDLNDVIHELECKTTEAEENKINRSQNSPNNGLESTNEKNGKYAFLTVEVMPIEFSMTFLLMMY